MVLGLNEIPGEVACKVFTGFLILTSFQNRRR